MQGHSQRVSQRLNYLTYNSVPSAVAFSHFHVRDSTSTDYADFSPTHQDVVWTGFLALTFYETVEALTVIFLCTFYLVK